MDFRIYIQRSISIYKEAYAKNFIVLPEAKKLPIHDSGEISSLYSLTKDGVLLLPRTGPLCLHLHPLRLANVTLLFLFSYPSSIFRFIGSFIYRFQCICSFSFHVESSIVIGFYCFHSRIGSLSFFVIVCKYLVIAAVVFCYGILVLWLHSFLQMTCAQKLLMGEVIRALFNFPSIRRLRRV